jgi:hypothetical protein
MTIQKLRDLFIKKDNDRELQNLIKKTKEKDSKPLRIPPYKKFRDRG